MALILIVLGARLRRHAAQHGGRTIDQTYARIARIREQRRRR